MRRVILIRDDDLNYFTKIENIYYYYESFMKEKIPVCFAAIALVNPARDNILIDENLNKIDKMFNIKNNKELINLFKINENFEILQHGCTHENFGKIREYQLSSDNYKRTIIANKVLSKTFNRKINTFVAPHDSFSNMSLKMLSNLNMNIIRGRFNKNIIFEKEYINNIFGSYVSAIKASIYSKDLMPPFKINKIRNIYECSSIRIRGRNHKYIFKALSFIKKNGGAISFTNHIEKITNQRKSILLEIINYAKKNNIQIVNDKTLFNFNYI